MRQLVIASLVVGIFIAQRSPLLAQEKEKDPVVGHYDWHSRLQPHYTCGGRYPRFVCREGSSGFGTEKKRIWQHKVQFDILN